MCGAWQERAKGATAGSARLPCFCPPSLRQLISVVSCITALVHQIKKAVSKQMPKSVHRCHRGFNTVHWQCCSCTATTQPSVPHQVVTLSPSYSQFSVSSEIPGFIYFALPATGPALGWSILSIVGSLVGSIVGSQLAAEAAAGRSPGVEERVDLCPCLGGGFGADARGKGHLFPPQPWTRPCSLLRVTPH